MDIASYLSKKRSSFDEKSGNIKDFVVFDYNYIPEKPVTREEAKQIVNSMLQFEMSGIPTHMAIIGSRGSGKTMILKYLKELFQNETGLDVLYVNCRHYNTSFKIFAYLLDNENSAGASLVDLYQRFMQQYKNKTVVILDEVNLMSSKDKNREILYFLSRSEQPYMVIILSNTPHVLKQLDPATRSSLQPLPLHFKNYNAEQIYEILQDRAQKGLHNWDDGHLSQIAALTTQKTNSDARVAIKTLYYKMMNPSDDTEKCFEDARRDIVIDVVNDLADANLMILWAAATNKSDLVKDIYKRYCRFSQDHQIKPFSYMYFYTNLGYLQSVGLLALVATKIDRIYTNRVVLTFDKTVAEQICKLRFE
ncbi:MAG: orc1/cdc6 family replication initiation protein [Phycisphaerae bacterium]|nr:orc1/cdc6 family replication initiation protein [Phycisphaerae bacterium]